MLNSSTEPTPHAPATSAGFHHGSEYQPAGTGLRFREQPGAAAEHDLARRQGQVAALVRDPYPLDVDEVHVDGVNITDVSDV